MVTLREKPRQPYDLDLVKAAVRDPNGFTITPRARIDAENLGYDTGKVKEVILALTQENFHGFWILKKEGKPVLNNKGDIIAYDVYKPTIEARNGDVCQIYLKINFLDGRLSITSVQSFHLDR